MQTDTITLRELKIRYTVKTDAAGEPIVVGRTVTTPADSAAVFTTMLQDEASEVFAMLCLSTKHRVLAYHEVSRGCLDSTLVHPREVFKALLANAAAIVLAHNHPSGDPTPSQDDMILTRRLVDAGSPRASSTSTAPSDSNPVFSLSFSATLLAASKTAWK